MNKSEEIIFKVAVNYLDANEVLEPEFLGEFESHQDANTVWKGYFAAWIANGKKTVCTTVGKLLLLVAAVVGARGENLTTEAKESVCGGLSALVDQKWLTQPE